MRKHTTEEFIDKAKEVHGDKYDYSEVNYINAQTKVFIICKEHGVFEQTPNNHISKKQGCGECYGLHKTNHDIIKEFTSIHGDRYEYDKVEYKGWNTKVEIRCKEHGYFSQTPNAHLRGGGCDKCANILIGNKKRRKWSDILEEIKEIHGENYDYSNSLYINASTKIDIKCNICGHEFGMTTNAHISKRNGCPKCAGNAKITWDDFLKRANEKHNSFYNYPEYFEIKNNSTKIPITCPNHGIFNQSIGKHLQGQGCKSCVNKISKAEQELFEFIKKEYSDAEQTTRKIIPPYEIDIYVPSKKLGIEYNGTYWHSEKFRHKNHRENKTKLCLEKDVKLIHVEELDWNKNKEEIKVNILELLKNK